MLWVVRSAKDCRAWDGMRGGAAGEQAFGPQVGNVAAAVQGRLREGSYERLLSHRDAACRARLACGVISDCSLLMRLQKSESTCARSTIDLGCNATEFATQITQGAENESGRKYLHRAC
eukprot:6176403-Pleurochrysis_carterae.AAC.1